MVIETQTIKTYCIGKDMPKVRHLPHGDTFYNKLYYFHELDDLENLIHSEISNLLFSIKKYDSQYESEHKEMCDEMKALRAYLQAVLVDVQALDAA